MGLAMNIPALEARRTIAMAKAIAVAFGDENATEAAIRQATGDAALAYQAKVRMMHSKAVGK